MENSGRQQILNALRAEIIGPDPRGNPLDINDDVVFSSFEEARQAWVDSATRQEIIGDRQPPMRRYATGVLFPEKSKDRDIELSEELVFVDIEGNDSDAVLSEPQTLRVGVADLDANDYDLSTANTGDPQSAAISFVLPQDTVSVVIRISGAYYEEFKVKIGNTQTDRREVSWYVRRPIAFESRIKVADLRARNDGFLRSAPQADRADHPLEIDVYCYLRKHAMRPEEFLTVAIKNNSSSPNCNTHGLFQTEFWVDCESQMGHNLLFPAYPEREDSLLLQSDPEARSISLLYRDYQTYAVGHGCSATWAPEEGQAASVGGCFFPTYETPSITPDIFDSSGKSLAISMRTLAGLEKGVDSISPLIDLVSAYAGWIDSLRVDAGLLEDRHQQAASLHIYECERALERMHRGIELLQGDEIARLAFHYANESVYRQQLETPPTTRRVSISKSGTRIVEAPVLKDPTNIGFWRPFQIGFLLSALSSTANPTDVDRETVDLIFFPTGGGKTEAYQALIAFSLFYNRLSGTDQAVGAIMRYTLRLLTTQQFTRAASLICTMELVRRSHGVDGEPFSIGIWVGGDVTPLHRAEAISQLKALHNKQKTHHFLLTRCPRCSTSFERIEEAKGSSAWPAFREFKGRFTNDHRTVIFVCPNTECEFGSEESPLPVWVVDDDIFDQRPSLIIATVDKFAQVAFRGDISRLFGMDENGVRRFSPPSLIVQDELHLISGPLGTLVGLYEALFEEFCIDRRTTESVAKPKIVCSTATIRNYQTQIRSLYSRESSVLFPPHGLSIEDSFFARYSRDLNSGTLSQGRLYIGLLGTSLRSVQDLQVRTQAALIQAPMDLPESQRDPWYTTLSFFNRIQDIGTTFTLTQINTAAYLKSLWQRKNIPRNERRYINARSLLELTSRIDNAQLPNIIDKLQRRVGDDPIDICLASNIIEVGVDIPRLSLMTILGQPKTTAQYIQVTGRVGREWWHRPGLVVTMYPPKRPRDRSHFEKFRSYHQRLYASVEPTSVTPFSSPALERAVHAVIVGYVRNVSSKDLSPQSVPPSTIDEISNILRERVLIVDPDQAQELDRLINKRIDQWRLWGRTDWEARHDRDSKPLMYRAGSYVHPDHEGLAWQTPPTMRNVDAECVAQINDIYVLRQRKNDYD